MDVNFSDYYDTVVGTGLKSSELHDMLHGSYVPDEYKGGNGWSRDHELSTDTSSVYRHNDGRAVVAHRGTEGTLADWGNNMKYASTGEIGYKQTQRFKDAKKVQKLAEEKYGQHNISTIGHSQGGLLAETLGKNGHEIITVNKATNPFQSNKPSKHQYDIRSDFDAVSSFRDPFKKKDKRSTTIKSKTKNALKEHSYDILKRKGDDHVFGRGYAELVKGAGYTIREHTREQAKKLGVSVKPSTVKDKKIDVHKGGEKVASVGHKDYSDYATLLKTAGKEEADRRRKAYKSRHEMTRHKVGTNSYYADKLLW